MAASSSGVEWTSIIKPILAASYGSLSKLDVANFVKGIIRSESDFEKRDVEFEPFFTAFSILAAEYLSSGADCLEKSQVSCVSHASKVLLRFLVERLSRSEADDSQLARLLLLAVQGLCQGKSTLQVADRLALTADMKVARLPGPSKTASQEKEAEPLKRPRSDLTAAILEQLTTPLSPLNVADSPEAAKEAAETEAHGQFVRRNVASLKALNASDRILDVCLGLKSLKLYLSGDEKSSTTADALHVKQQAATLLAEVSLVHTALGLPILEPLNADKLEKLAIISLGCLQAAVACASSAVLLNANQATVKNKEEELDAAMVGVVEKSIEVADMVAAALTASKHVEKGTLLNVETTWAVTLVQGLWQQVSATYEHRQQEKGKSPSRAVSGRVNLQKVQQGFSVLSVALAGQALKLCTHILTDLDEDDKECTDIPTIAPENLSTKYSAAERVAYLLNAAPLLQLLHYLAIISYRKAYTLKKALKPTNEEDTVSFSDSTIYNGDDFSFSEDSSEDEDSEPILGQWLEKTLAPKMTSEGSEAEGDLDESKSGQQTAISSSSGLQSSVVPEKGEPHGYIQLASEVFNFLTSNLVCSPSELIRSNVAANYCEQHTVILAAIIRDLDRETARTKTGSIPAYFGASLGALYFKFSHCLTLYTHNLLATSILPETLQISLLSHLGVNPTPQEQPWPLQVYPRALAVLSQYIVMKKQPEQETLILRIWSRLVNTLLECVTSPAEPVDSENEDLNVEHAQLLLFFFHYLSLLQKKSVLLQVSAGLIKCGELIAERVSTLRESQLLHTARLIHLFEHLMRHLYEAPAVLLEQIRWNLFSATGLLPADKGSKIASRMFCPSQDVVDNMTKGAGQEDSGMRPRYYSLTSLEMNHEECPKLDGLACNFVLATPEKLKYPSLIDALIHLLGVLHKCDSSWCRKGQSPSLLCTVQYLFCSAWRMLLLLPPSAPFVSQLGVGADPTDVPLLLYTLVWGPRTGCSVFSSYIKDNLIKQGMVPNADTLLKTVSSTQTSLHYTATVARSVLGAFRSKYLQASNSPSLDLSDVIAVDVVLAKLLGHLHDTKQQAAVETAISLLPDLLAVLAHVSGAVRKGLLAYVEDSNEWLLDVLAIASSQNTHTANLTLGLRTLLPASVRSALDRWNSSKATYVPGSAYASDQLPGESHLLSVLNNHVSKLYRCDSCLTNESLKHLAHALVSFSSDLATKLGPVDLALRQQIVAALLPVSQDACAEYLFELLSGALLEASSDDQQRQVFCTLLAHCYRLLLAEGVDERVHSECLKIMEALLEQGAPALLSFFTDADLTRVLLARQTTNRRFFNQLFAAADKNPGGPLEALCVATVSKLSGVERKELSEWLRHLLLGQLCLDSPEVPSDEIPEPAESSSKKTAGPEQVENQQLLRYLVSYIVKEGPASEALSRTILEALIPIGSRLLTLDMPGTGFSDVMQIMVTLANSGSRRGHIHLFCAATLWLEQCKEFIVDRETLKKIEKDQSLTGKTRDIVEAAGQLLNYVADIIGALGISQNNSMIGERAQSPWDSSDLSPPDTLDCEWMEEWMGGDDEDSTGEDSDEDSLCNKLCTFTLTQKEFMNQHWYHCHTCKMVDGVGVCSVCARVCHKTHDVTYAKYGNFFCDCGAKDDNSCLALAKRSPEPQPAPPFSVDSSQPRRATSSPVPERSERAKDDKARHRSALSQQLEACAETLMHHAAGSPMVGSLLEMLCLLVGAVRAACERNSSVGCHARAQQALLRLHTHPKTFETCDQLMVPTLGSQEGAFENVRSNYPGDQGQTIRQLLSAHMIRRVAMCCLSSPHGRRQHLAVSHEKGKITVLQLSALLKQADSSKRKLTLTRLASAPVPFTVLSITGNPCNEDFLAVCGLKDCHVLTFSGSGTVSQHLVLHPHLETGNYIIKAVWLPGSQTQLALITADFVKVYDLAKDVLSPQFYFLVPSGKIRDATFVFAEDSEPALLLMSSAGYIYSQTMGPDSSAEHGPFYVTNTLEVNHPDVKDANGLIAGGGVSVYYSHTLQLLFFSYNQGKSFLAPLSKDLHLGAVFQIQLAKAGKGSQTQAAQPLCQWSEVPNHPGLVCSVLQSSNNPVILMLRPDTVLVQEIKVVPAKAKIMDMVAIRHAASGSELRTTLILLCEDGSLRIYMAGQEHTSFWLSVQPSNRSSKRRKATAIKTTSKASKPSAAPAFPVDFFEHCQLMSEVEYGGNDVLETYNTEQIKNRLAKQGQYIANNRPAGFTVEITNSDPSMVITGIRIQVGSQDPLRSPTFVEVQGRSIQLNVTGSRWFDFPLTREESLQADRKLSVTFGPSQDPEYATMLDSMLVYGKTKDSFGWPEENEESGSSSGTVAAGTGDTENNSALEQMTSLEKVVSGVLEVLDCSFTLFGCLEEKQVQQKLVTIDLATKMLTLPTSNNIQTHSKSLLAALHASRGSYYDYKDRAILEHLVAVLDELSAIPESRDLDAETFYRVVLMARSIAAARPQNLHKMAEALYQNRPRPFVAHLLDIFWRLHAARPVNSALAPVCVPGLRHIETTVHALVEIVHAFAVCDIEQVPLAAQHYLQLLLCPDSQVSFSSKQALIRVLRPRQRSRRRAASLPPPSPPITDVDTTEPIRMLGEEAAAVPPPAQAPANPIAALLNAGGGYPPLLGIPPEAMDETMMELAIALSLEEDGDPMANLLSVQQNLQQGMQNLEAQQAAQQALQNLQVLAGQAGPSQAPEAGHLSDTTASAPCSDDEGSNAATDGSTLRTSPAEQGGSESGGSGAESFEMYAVGRVDESSKSLSSQKEIQPVAEQQQQAAEARSLLVERLLLEKLLDFLPKLREVGGVQAIPLLQVILILTSDLDGDDLRDRHCLEALLVALINELGIKRPVDAATASECKRSPLVEVHLVMMRFLSVLMSRAKTASKAATASDAFVSQTTATSLVDSRAIDYCLSLLQGLLVYWKGQESGQTTSASGLLKSQPVAVPPDMSPFFLKQYVKGLGGDVFESYPQLLTEMALRLPYQVLKHSDCAAALFGQQWRQILCDYMMTAQAPFVRRQVRKLLMFLCGSKDKYRQSRDLHSLEFHMGRATDLAADALAYDQLVQLMEHLKACLEVATSRPNNWQNFCLSSEPLIPFLFRASCTLDEGVCPTVLQLLQHAICRPRERERSVESDDDRPDCSLLVGYVNKNVASEVMGHFIKTFLLETNAASVRWQAHELVLSLFEHSSDAEQQHLLSLLWSFWPSLKTYGKKASQFVDLLGYFSKQTADKNGKLQEMVNFAVEALKAQNQVLAQHPNTSIYSKLGQFIELDGYFFESRPCLVCNSPEVPLSSIKLSAVKVDSKFTTTTQIVKLVGSHSISRITLRIGDIKRAKMVRNINIYYNNRTVQAVVELKNKMSMWHKAKRVTLTSGQAEVKVDFPLPIVACNLMIEYGDFYENIQASSETLQCPRCGVSVPSNPGVCGNCGENVFQCHKCRAINYDEKDPFLCHACGFCKYAKFEYTLVARACCAVDPIENDDDRRKTLAAIASMQERADRVYKQLMAIRPTVENILHNVEEGHVSSLDDTPSSGSASSGTSNTHVKHKIQLLAQRYCTDCKGSFEELGKISQKVLACREEILAYDRKQRESAPRNNAGRSLSHSCKGCYGCASATMEHCLTLLKALASIPGPKEQLRRSGLVSELVERNLHRRSASVQQQVRQLLCLLARDQPETTAELCQLLTDRISLALSAPSSGQLSVQPEMSLLSSLICTEDSCWEEKLRCVVRLYLAAVQQASPPVTEAVLLPCLHILLGLMNPPKPSTQSHKDKSVLQLSGIAPAQESSLSLDAWLNGDARHSFAKWRSWHLQRKEPISREEARTTYLEYKYLRRWRASAGHHVPRLRFSQTSWLRHVLFNQGSRVARQAACKMLETFFACQVPQRKQELLNLLTEFLDDLGSAGETAAEFLALYRTLIQADCWKRYLALRGTLVRLADLISREISQLSRQEESSLDLAEGFALKSLTELLSCFLEHDAIKRLYKGRLVGAVLNGYLALRRLAVQRTRLIDETQDKLFELLEEMTSGTEAETNDFMRICLDAVERCEADDDLTPVFILERLCSIISPEENDVGDFLLTLDKDPQQEDFLQGRMLGNPYQSSEPGLGPLMRDVKNKICQDCELVALLEDDNGMELLVNNKIISLDLPVREVYKKIWLTEGDGEAMRVVYRMRGLLGDATEEFVETLDNKTKQQVDNEQVYKMANVMSESGGIQVLLKRLLCVNNVVRSKPLLQVLLKLFLLCTKVRSNQELLATPSVGAIEAFLATAEKCLTAGKAVEPRTTEQILNIMETILTLAATKPLDHFLQLTRSAKGAEHVKDLLQFASGEVSPQLLQHLAKVAGALSYGDPGRMAVLTNYLAPALDFEKYDLSRLPDEEQKMEFLCLLASGMDHNAAGSTLKDHLNQLGVVRKAVDYIAAHAPPASPLMLVPGTDAWKDFISRPALKAILRVLAGLATEHEPTQLEVSTPECIAVLHRLEQVSSEERVGSLSENLLEALGTNEAVKERIEKVRHHTRAEKKRLAMAMREKQLGALGMHTNEKGQVTASSSLLSQMDELGEETGLVCVICREGYRCQPSKVLGIYTYTKRCALEEEERKQRRSLGYSTVSHFNVVHIDCHMAAVRQARTRDEWESAALQNANTRCNGLLPLWGPVVPESAFASCLARHNTYLQECTGHRDISYSSTVHDLKLLLLKFAYERSFNEDTGGGGPESNMHLLPYLVHMALYVLNTTRSASREEKSLSAFLAASQDTWVVNSFVPDGPLYWCVMSVLLRSFKKWEQEDGVAHLKRLLILAQTRHVEKSNTQQVKATKLSDSSVKEYAVYKPYLLYYALVDGLYKYCFKKVTCGSEEQWPNALAEYIRHNDENLVKASNQLLSFYSDELLPCASFDEFCDIVGLLGEINNPESFLSDTLRGVSG
ncbi:E3 ubiquitin-protein ligase UBR4 [Cloeon dipterum]|uniref:E3 ubiquitin-protein ligase UBR4 n=1 Tax=Cloeon dipterum TaxID=197152 RepID=UPI00322014C6